MSQGVSGCGFTLQSDASACPSFRVLLGPDYAGKSSILARLLGSSRAYCFSYDHDLSDEQNAIVRSIRRAFKIQETGSTGYSCELLVSVFHVYMIHLRDRILACGTDKPIIVDSYYYKLFAKCILLGIGNEGIFQLWRSLPRPGLIIYLDVDMDLAWQRSGAGKNLNRMEYYGQEPTRRGFGRFQSDLRDLMLSEVAGIEVKIVQVFSDGNPTAADIEQSIFDGFEHRRPERGLALDQVGSSEAVLSRVARASSLASGQSSSKIAR